MSALRFAHPGQPVTFDPADPATNPATPYRNPFDHPTGHRIEARSGLNSRTDAALHRAEQRRYKARKRGEG